MNFFKTEMVFKGLSEFHKLVLSVFKLHLLIKTNRRQPNMKKEDPSRAKNYRPVSVLPSISKIFERILHRQVSSYVD